MTKQAKVGLVVLFLGLLVLIAFPSRGRRPVLGNEYKLLFTQVNG